MTRRRGSFGRALELLGRRHEEPRRASRPDCACGDPWYVHASQADPERTVPGSRYEGDCAGCARRGEKCGWFAARLVVTVVSQKPDELAGEPPIPDDPDELVVTA